jgi:hypothetical protein
LDGDDGVELVREDFLLYEVVREDFFLYEVVREDFLLYEIVCDGFLLYDGVELVRRDLREWFV